MNEVIEVLMYLFENHMGKDCHIEVCNSIIAEELSDRGFRIDAINKAMDWLDGLFELQKISEAAHSDQCTTVRIYNDWECERIDKECRGLLLVLEQMNILDGLTREMVINRLMALEVEVISLAEVKWVALMVLFNQRNNKEIALACMEKFVLQDAIGRLH
jgi:Smg protein